MSPASSNAAVARARIADTARALSAPHGGWRAAALMRGIEGRAAPAFADLAELPAWVCWPVTKRARLARLVALAELAPRVGRVVDGAVLGGLAALVGAAALDWAIAEGEGMDFVPPLSDAPGAAWFDGRGMALLAAALPPAIAAEIGLSAADRPPAPDLARRLVQTALQVFGELAPGIPA